jgi:hypothetical protein
MRKEVLRLQNQNINGEAYMMADKIAKENPYAIRDQLAFYIQKSWDAFPILKLQNIQEILKQPEEMENPCE